MRKQVPEESFSLNLERGMSQSDMDQMNVTNWKCVCARVFVRI